MLVWVIIGFAFSVQFPVQLHVLVPLVFSVFHVVTMSGLLCNGHFGSLHCAITYLLSICAKH